MLTFINESRMKFINARCSQGIRVIPDSLHANPHPGRRCGFDQGLEVEAHLR